LKQAVDVQILEAFSPQKRAGNLDWTPPQFEEVERNDSHGYTGKYKPPRGAQRRAELDGKAHRTQPTEEVSVHCQ
jgi:hypothetical protein